MAYWGIALTQIHPLWPGVPSKEVMEKGATALNKAFMLNPPTKLEQDFIQALQSYYNNWKKTPYPERIKNWEQAQYALYKAYPKDAEAIALYALTHLATAKKSDRSFRQQEHAGQLLEKLHAKKPSHPAGFHYTIHAYDNPKLAPKAEKIARNYDKIAPDVPHALHMPSHIFVRLGLWPETIQWNIRSAAAAKRQSLKNGVMSMHYAHAMDYLMYAYLQQGQDKKAKDILEQLNTVENFQDSFATAYGIAATRARFYLEQHDWKNATTIPLAEPKNFPWKKYPAVQGITYFAQGLGTIMNGKPNKASFFIKKLNHIANMLMKDDLRYWAILTDSKRYSLLAWQAFETGKKDEALRLMIQAAHLEDSVDKHPVTPGAVLPARELLGDMLMKLNKPLLALQAYQTTLRISPNRLNSLYGAANAAEKSGNKVLAKQYYTKIISQTKNTDPQNPIVVQAKAFLKNN